MNKQKEAAMSHLDSLKNLAMELLAKAHREERRYSRKAKALEAGYVHPDDEAAVKAIIAALAALAALASRKPVVEAVMYQVRPRNVDDGEGWHKVAKREYDDMRPFPGYDDAEWERRTLYATHPQPAAAKEQPNG